ncbi:MAG: DUF418 domain-containing protein [Sphingomonadales bacterium]|jgi:uncharacterized protein|nr:DUF418 domain-containing protein [Sphingomonadales bacterium]MBK9004796.1 DUF418 domain-containing protein [Sphingomonadales bacterium]MBK9267477.1 DUF418 domain-containing protein [Sphingomonadales bacterium]MBP6433238.1 DUF418 domain-containing protein [Sphingorhabdus sp.]
MSSQALAGRHITLDALRGFAVMGILAMNIVAFALPEWAYVAPGTYGGDSMADKASWLFSFILIDGKMRGLFSLLFGASMALIIERAEAKGESPAKVHYARMLWLLLFGLAHYLFIWWGDILFLYAVIGCIAYLFRKWEATRLIKWALIIYGLGFVLYALQFGGLQFLQFMATQPGADPSMVAQYQEVMRDPELRVDASAEIAAYAGSYADIVARRWGDVWHLLVLIPQSFAETLPLMMLGMAMKKNGFLTGEWQDGDYARWAKKLLIPGLAISAGLGFWVAATGYDLITTLANFLAWSMIPRLLMTIGYAALLVMLIRSAAGSALIGRVAAAGRAAFTNYLGTSIVMTTIFYGYGFGLYNQIGRASLWLFVIGAWALMLLWSKPWLERYHYGPFEWLWRSLARGGLQSLKK